MRHYRARQRGENIPLRKPGPKPRKPAATITAHPGADRGYPLDFSSPLSHTATELEKAGTRGATIAEMAATYYHPNPGDLARAQRCHGLDTSTQAKRFLIDRAVSALGAQVSEGRSAQAATRYRLAVPFDDLRFDGQQVWRSTPE